MRIRPAGALIAACASTQGQTLPELNLSQAKMTATGTVKRQKKGASSQLGRPNS